MKFIGSLTINFVQRLHQPTIKPMSSSLINTDKSLDPQNINPKSFQVTTVSLNNISVAKYHPALWYFRLTHVLHYGQTKTASVSRSIDNFNPTTAITGAIYAPAMLCGCVRFVVRSRILLKVHVRPHSRRANRSLLLCRWTTPSINDALLVATWTFIIRCHISRTKTLQMLLLY